MKKSIFLFFAAILCAMSTKAATKPELLYLSKDTWDTGGAWFAAYFYGGDNGSAWVKMTYTEVTDKFVCKTPQDKSFTNVIFVRMDKDKTALSFDSKWNQTADLELQSNNNCYTVTDWDNKNNKWSNIEPTLTVAGTPTSIFKQEWKPAETSNDMQLLESVYQLKKTNIPLAKDIEVLYKVTRDHKWDKSWGGDYKDGNAGYKITDTYLYNLTFKFDVSNYKSTCTATKVEHYITGNSNLVGDNAWNEKAQKMTYDATTNKGVYTHTFKNLSADKIYDLKITDGSWNNHWGHSDLKTKPEHISTFSDNNISFYLSEPGNVTVTFDAINGKIELSGNFAKIVPTINLLGLDGNWDATQENKMTRKSTDIVDIVSNTTHLEPGTHTFKIYVAEFDKWYSNNTAIIRDNALVDKVLSDEGNDIAVHADIAGDYEFIWNYETKELSVVYPNTTVEYDKIYFVNSNKWAKVYAYLWLDGSEPSIKQAEWPGAETNKEGTVNGYDIHCITFIKDSYNKCIFNDGNDNKTADLAIMNDYKYFYDLTGSWYANLEDIEASTNKFVLGEFNNWAKEHGEFLKVDENIYSITIPIEAGTYEFKVVDNYWHGNGGTMQRGGENVETGGWPFGSDNESKCKLIADTDGDYIFTWYSNTKKLTVTYPSYTVNTVANPTEGGTITGDGKYAPNATVTLTATANTGYDFVNWTKDGEQVSDNPTYEFTATENVDLVANFKLKTFTVQFLDYDGTELQSSSVNYGETPAYNGTTPVREADAQYTYTFSGWDPEIAAVTSDQTYTAQYSTTVNQYIVTATAAEGGTVTGAGTYDYGTSVTLTATANTGYEFVNWTEDGVEVSADAELTLTVKKNVTLTANFAALEPETYTRTVTVGNFGTICLPFGSNNYTGAEFYELVGQEKGKVYIGSVTTLEAGVPYIFRATGTELAVYSDGTNAATPGNKNGLHGTFTDDTEVAVGNYILHNNAICECNAICWVNANRAYIVWAEIPTGEPQKMPGRKYIGMGVQGENEETAIEDILSAEAPAKVIENGQLIIIRNGVKYNVQGQKL